MENERLQPIQSLQLIESMINKARNRFSENGHLYLLWGWVILCCAIGHFAGIWWKLFPKPELIWMFTWVALIYQTVYLVKSSKKKQVKTYTDELLTAVWLVFVGCGVIMGMVVSKKADWDTMYPLILMLYGVPTILSGVILRFKPLIIGGFICWLLSIVSVFIPLVYSLLLIALAVAAAWIIPGYMMQKRYAQEN